MRFYKKVFIYCPRRVTGGPETHHAVADVINRNGGMAYIVYKDFDKEIIPQYSGYKVQTSNIIEDSEENLLIVSEMFTDFLYKFNKINKAIMFLSLEYYKFFNSKYAIKDFLREKNIPLFFYPALYFFCFTFNGRLLRKMNFRKINFKDENLIVTCNGEVNKSFLVRQEGRHENDIGYICGPLNREFLNTNRTNCLRENIVVFNPKKGFEFTNKIIERVLLKTNKIIFCPIENMNADQVHKLLLKSKVYIDFGHHPGPERIPREAVVSGCNIITSNLGSAANQIDVPIDTSFKFSCEDNNIEKISDLILDMVFRYDDYYPLFNRFREKVYNQYQLFETNVLKYFYIRKD